MKRTAKSIVQILRARHRGDEWACFEELRCGTGYNRGSRQDRENRIDLFCVNLWPSKRMADGTPRSVAYEVKISHADFLKELDNPGKRGSAEKRATDCYFAAPTGVLKPEEIPDPWGLIVVGDSGVRVTKATIQRSIDPWDWDFASAICRRSADPRQGGPTKAWMYAGRELDESELRKVAREVYGESVETARALAVSEYKAGDEMKALRELQFAVREEVGWTRATAAGFREWVDERNRTGLNPKQRRELVKLRAILNDIIGEDR